MILYIIYLILSPILWILIKILSVFHHKIKLRSLESFYLFREVKQKIINNEKDVILFHAASNGELEQLKPIFREIDRSQYFLLLTISSPSLKDTISEDMIDAYCYQAFDLPWNVYNFFSQIKPKKYIITRHDIWPNHIIISKILSIKLYLINANLPKASIRNYPIFISLYKYLFSKFDLIYTMSKEMKSRLSTLINDSNKIKIYGDTRIDEIVYRKEESKDRLLPDSFNDSNNIIFGSIENKDVNIIFNAISNIDKNIKYIFVPHEIDEKLILNIELKLKELNIESCRYSNMDKMKNNINAIIIDRVGILAELYKYSKIAYIGCGFSKGVHNVIEPAIYGNLICFGPNYYILQEAEEMVESNLAFPVKSSKELLHILNYISDENYLNNISLSLKKYINIKKTSAMRIIDDIL